MTPLALLIGALLALVLAGYASDTGRPDTALALVVVAAVVGLAAVAGVA